MKIVKLSFTFLACAFVASCSNDVTPVSEEGASTSEVLSEKRTFEEALQIAKSSISMIEEDEGMTRGGQGGRTIDLDRAGLSEVGQLALTVLLTRFSMCSTLPMSKALLWCLPTRLRKGCLL